MSEDTPAIREVAASGVSFRVVRTERPTLRAHLGVSRLSLPDQEEARDATGYERGAITPLASATTWPVVADATLAERDRVAIGAGAHGVNVHVEPADLIRILDAEVAQVTRAGS